MKTTISQDGAAVSTVMLTGTVARLQTQVLQGGPGPAGVAGPAGPAGQTIETTDRTADVALSGHRAVRGTTPAGADYCGSATPSHAPAFLGLTQGAASSGTTVTVQRTGVIVEGSWTWTPWMPVFVGASGTLTQSSPSSGFSLVVGVALSATSILLRPQPPIYL